jgi:hypothetical protein
LLLSGVLFLCLFRFNNLLCGHSELALTQPEAARSAALEIKSRFPVLQVSIYDSVTKSRTMVDVPKSV